MSEQLMATTLVAANLAVLRVRLAIREPLGA